MALALACGTRTSGTSTGPRSDTACDRFVAAWFGVGCPGAQLPASEVARMQDAFAPVCANAMTAPGSTLTDAQLDACSSDLLAHSCFALMELAILPASCHFQGMLPAGVGCQSSAQCQSGFCGFAELSDPTHPPIRLPPGGLHSPDCGVCVAPAAPGMYCDWGLCADGSACEGGLSGTGLPVSTCVTTIAAGGDCSAPGIYCAYGLYCDPNHVCSPGTGDVGAACDLMNPSCKPYLTCPLEPNATCTAPAIGTQGAPCDENIQNCASGLGCINYHCAAIRWLDPGQPCASAIEATDICLHGSCSLNGTCPALIPDGQPCTTDGTTTCDDSSQCVQGVCFMTNPLTCRVQFN
jgi:hypothetical protein